MKRCIMSMAGLVLAVGGLFGSANAASAQTWYGHLTRSDRVSQSIRPGCHYDTYHVYMQAGCTCGITLDSSQFDTYLFANRVSS